MKIVDHGKLLQIGTSWSRNSDKVHSVSWFFCTYSLDLLKKLSLLKITLILGIIYQAYDLKEKRDVALKQEKSDKARRILHNEYAFLLKLQSTW